ncbi:hypothetical protein CMI37_26910 [Candidatus Pacearchaeota archaeon]|nr:hypothetical protein [Candidatus Pacearchaeota archaeon]
MDKLSLVIPAHNESGRIERTLREYFSYFGELKKNGVLDFEIVVVLNACSDNTSEIVGKFKDKELVILDFVRGGKGFAITEGFKDALKRGSDFIGFVDADCSTPPEAFYDLVKNIGEADGVIADRWHKDSIVAKQTFFRQFLSRGYNFIIRSLFFLPYNDTQCGAKVFTREILEKNIHKMVSSQWNYDIALLFCLKKESRARIKSIPTTWMDEEASKVNIRRTPVTMFASAVRLRLIHSPLRFTVRFYRKLPQWAKFH